MHLSYIDYPYKMLGSLSELCVLNQYRVAQISELPSGLPGSLLQKSPGVLIVSSGDMINDCYIMVNFHRLGKKSVIDQQPLIMAFDHLNQTSYAAFLQHGSWSGRTYSVNTSGLIEIAKASGIQSYFPCLNLPKSMQGPLEELEVVSPTNMRAFWNSIAALDRELGEHTT